MSKHELEAIVARWRKNAADLGWNGLIRNTWLTCAREIEHALELPAGTPSALTSPSPASAGDGESLARQFHEAYERLAPQFGYETRAETRQFDPTSPNGKLMIAVCSALAVRDGAPRGEVTDADVEIVAKGIFDHWSFAKRFNKPDGVEWVVNGNSTMQEVARDYARAALETLTARPKQAWGLNDRPGDPHSWGDFSRAELIELVERLSEDVNRPKPADVGKAGLIRSTETPAVEVAEQCKQCDAGTVTDVMGIKWPCPWCRPRRYTGRSLPAVEVVDNPEPGWRAMFEDDAERLRQFERWANDGLRPMLVFNDNGWWAVSFDGGGDLSLEEPPPNGSFVAYVESSQWRETVAEAIDAATAPTAGKESESIPLQPKALPLAAVADGVSGTYACPKCGLDTPHTHSQVPSDLAFEHVSKRMWNDHRISLSVHEVRMIYRDVLKTEAALTPPITPQDKAFVKSGEDGTQLSRLYAIATSAVCVARNEWGEKHEERWLETDENHPDEFIGRAVVDALRNTGIPATEQKQQDKAAPSTVDAGTDSQAELEPNGGNLYRPHKFMVTSGQFWRCKHGVTGFADEAEWIGCERCKRDDPEAYRNWHKNDAASTQNAERTTNQSRCTPIVETDDPPDALELDEARRKGPG